MWCQSLRRVLWLVALFITAVRNSSGKIVGRRWLSAVSVVYVNVVVVIFLRRLTRICTINPGNYVVVCFYQIIYVVNVSRSYGGRIWLQVIPGRIGTPHVSVRMFRSLSGPNCIVLVLDWFRCLPKRRFSQQFRFPFGKNAKDVKHNIIQQHVDIYFMAKGKLLTFVWHKRKRFQELSILKSQKILQWLHLHLKKNRM